MIKIEIVLPDDLAHRGALVEHMHALGFCPETTIKWMEIDAAELQTATEAAQAGRIGSGGPPPHVRGHSAAETMAMNAQEAAATETKRKRRTKAEIAADEASTRAAESKAASDVSVLSGGEQAQISTGEERVGPEDSPETQAQDAADEAAESAATKGPALTHDDVRSAAAPYVKKFGMPAAEEDVRKMLALALPGLSIEKISQIPDDQDSLRKAVEGLGEMVGKNPFGRVAVGAL